MHTIHRLFAVALLLVTACRWEHEDDQTDDADAAPSIDAAPAADADPGAPDATPESTIISCGAADCPRDTQVCCYTSVPITQTCTPMADPCEGTAVKATCDGPEDCSNGDVCCVGASDATCKPAAQCTGMSLPACHEDDDCVAPKTCQSFQFSPWTVCRNPV